MKSIAFIAISASFLLASPVFADAIVGKPAPQFEVVDAAGKKQNLADYKGKWVVLEWFNKNCPFVKKQYESSNMQKLQKTYSEKGVIWLTVNSSAKDRQGYVDGKTALADAKERNASPTSIILDPEGTLGKSYGAKTTPHMFIINPAQEIAYAGAIDDNDSSDPAVIPKSKNYVSAALDAGLANKPIETSISRPYGCSVKYK